MKYISEQTILNSWGELIKHAEATKSVLNKFFGVLELLAQINLSTAKSVLSNVQYHLKSADLAKSLQNLYFFGATIRQFTSNDDLYLIFPNQWQENIFSIFLKNQPLPISFVATICLQNDLFNDGETTTDVISKFKEKYNLSENENIFFYDDSHEIEFSKTLFDRRNFLNSIKQRLNIDSTNTTLVFSKSLNSKNPGELTAGPFIQPLYAGLENLNCVLISNINITDHYHITPTLFDVSQNINSLLPRNKIIYGAPGTGKSYELRKQANLNGFDIDKTIRITFHPNYTYQQFVGTYKPTPIYKLLNTSDNNLYASDKITKLNEPNNKEPIIDYSFVPGPLLTQLIKALNDLNNNYLIIIEEINRANVSSVFGDVFQLLDRNKWGESEYEIEFNADIINYLKGEGINAKKIKLPSNLFIWATMNSADQGVMPLDSAFKRRWSFEYITLNSREFEIQDRSISFQNKKYNWNEFRNKLNDRLKSLNNVPEDKLIGPFFLNNTELNDASAIKNKLLLYLRDDVVRHNPESLFLKKTFSDIIRSYDEGELIFNELDIPDEIGKSNNLKNENGI